MKLVLLVGLWLAAGTLARGGFNTACWNEMRISVSYYSLSTILWDETHNLEENIQNMIYMLQHLQNAVRSCEVDLNFSLEDKDQNQLSRVREILESLEIIETASAWNIDHKSYSKIDKQLISDVPPTFDSSANCTQGFEVLNSACRAFSEVYEHNGDLLKGLGDLVQSSAYVFLDCRDITQPNFLVQP